jgi:hypothetical protein
MTGREDFTDDEWTRLVRAPIVAGMAITLADPGGPIEVIKESTAVLKTINEAAMAGNAGLVDEAAISAAEMAQQRRNPLGDFKPEGGANAGVQILEELRAVNALLKQKATPEDAAAFREFLLGAAQRSADAAKEGGFMGFKAKQVSEGEQRMLESLREVLS